MIREQPLTLKEASVTTGFILVSTILVGVFLFRSSTILWIVLFGNLFGSFLAFWLSLLFAKVPTQSKTAFTLWALLPCAFQSPLFPYLGFVLLPVEMIVSALLLSFRSGLSMLKCLLVVAPARLIIMVGIYVFAEM